MESELIRAVYLFAFAFLFAAVEIEIEGAHGWAEKLPTWYRVSGRAARLYGRVMNGKPLTGYHLFMLFLPLVAFHLPFVQGVPWSWPAEAQTLATYFAWMVTWDFLWFVLNPAYGWRRFRPGEIWWHVRWWGPAPADYWQAIALSFILAATGSRVAAHARLLLVFAIATVLTALVAPAYHKWHKQMRVDGADERAAARIHHD